MNQENRNEIFFWTWLLAGVLSIGIALIAQLARAQELPRDEALILAQITIHEAGWEDTGDLEAIDAVLRAGAERTGMSYRAFARAYSGMIWAGRTSKPWVRHLDSSCSEPEEWPEHVIREHRDESTGEITYTRERHAPWRAYRSRCELVMERARATRAGEREHGCAVTPHDWGGAVDRARARRIGLIAIDCSLGDVETRNTFYVRPSLSPSPSPSPSRARERARGRVEE